MKIFEKMIIFKIIVLILLKIQRIKIGEKSQFFGFPIIIQRKGKIEIGHNFTLASGFLSNLIGLYQRSIIFARNGGRIIIGNNVSMSGITLYSFTSIIIGDNVLVGANTKIIDSDFHPIDPKDRLVNPDDKEKTISKEIVIDNNVFIGCNVLILKGVHIGKNSVIGAGSVVTKNIPENCIAVGNPAKVVKFLN